MESQKEEETYLDTKIACLAPFSVQLPITDSSSQLKSFLVPKKGGEKVKQISLGSDQHEKSRQAKWKAEIFPANALCKRLRLKHFDREREKCWNAVFLPFFVMSVPEFFILALEL